MISMTRSTLCLHVDLTNWHFLLRCNCFSSQRSELFDSLYYNLDPSFSKLNNKEKVAYLWYGSTSNPNTLNIVIINLVIKPCYWPCRFDKPLIVWPMKSLFLFRFSFHSKIFFFFFFERNSFEFEYYYLHLDTFYWSFS